jgi:AraC-like DNA-binding protein
MPGPQAVPVEHTDLLTRDMSVMAQTARQGYFEHVPRIGVADPDLVSASLHWSTAGDLVAGVKRWRGVTYEFDDAYPDDRLFGFVVTGGGGVTTSGRARTPFARGDVLLSPVTPYGSQQRDIAAELVGVPWSAITNCAGAATDFPGAVRFESLTPVSPAAARLWKQTVAFICGNLLYPAVSEVSALVIGQYTSVAARAMLAAFPNTTMTTSYLSSPGWAPPAALRQAADYMHTHAHQPVTLTEIAEAAGLTSRVLNAAFRRAYGLAVPEYLRRIRLERAYEELTAPDIAARPRVDVVAHQWGWVSVHQFYLAYRQRFGISPG